jgi:hypothetical protein
MGANNRNTLILIGLLVLVLAIAYPLLKGPSDTAVDPNQADPVGSEALSLLSQIQSIHMDFSVLQSREFLLLKDITQPLLSLPVGRTDPFAPTK